MWELLGGHERPKPETWQRSTLDQTIHLYLVAYSEVVHSNHKSVDDADKIFSQISGMSDATELSKLNRLSEAVKTQDYCWKAQ